MKILIAVPTFESIMPDTFKSIYNLRTSDYWCEFDFVRGYDCATARNNIARRAMEADADYVLMVDNDVVLPDNALIDMLDDPKDVCLGYYAHRSLDNSYSGRSCVCRWSDGKKRYFNYPLESEYTAIELKNMRDHGIYKVDIHGGGMGCALIRTDVFRRIQYPWFSWVNYKTGGQLSEDLYFCEQCHQHGIDIFTDTRVECGHMFRHIQWMEVRVK